MTLFSRARNSKNAYSFLPAHSVIMKYIVEIITMTFVFGLEQY
jgi:hypothetical protein